MDNLGAIRDQIVLDILSYLGKGNAAAPPIGFTSSGPLPGINTGGDTGGDDGGESGAPTDAYYWLVSANDALPYGHIAKECTGIGMYWQGAIRPLLVSVESTLSGTSASLRISTDANGGIRLLPASNQAVIIGDTAVSGGYRPLVIADQADQALLRGESLKVFRAGSPVGTQDILASLSYTPTNTDTAKQFTSLQAALVLGGTNNCLSNTQVADLVMTFNGSATFPAVTSNDPMNVLGLVTNWGASYTGSMPYHTGLIIAHEYNASASGTITQLDSILVQIPTAFPAGKLTTGIHLNLPAWGANVTNPYNFAMDTGWWKISGNQTFKDASGNTIGTITTTGQIGIGTAAPASGIDLHITRSTVDSSAQMRFTNDAQSWNFALAGLSADRFVIRDVTGAKDVMLLDTGCAAGTLWLHSTNVAIANGINLVCGGKITTYNNIATGGYGVPAIVDVDDNAARATAIGSTNLANTSADGIYEVSYHLFCQTVEGAGQTVYLTITNPIGGGQVHTSATITMSATTNHTTGKILCKNASGSAISYTTTIGGAWTTGRYILAIKAQRVN